MIILEKAVLGATVLKSLLKIETFMFYIYSLEQKKVMRGTLQSLEKSITEE